VAVQVTTGLAKSNGSLPPGGWLIVTCGLTAWTLRSAPGPTLDEEYREAFTFYLHWLLLVTALTIYINYLTGKHFILRNPLYV